MAVMAGLTTLQTIGMVSSAVSAVGQIQAGRAQARAYRAQAKQAELKGAQDALRYRQQGVEVLRRIRANTAAVTARAASGGMDPYSGSPQSLKNYAQQAGAEEFYLTRENAELARAIGDVNAQQYRMAASQAKLQSYIGAASSVGMAAATYGSIGTPSQSLTGFAGGGSASGAVRNVIYPTTGSIGMPSMVGG